MSAISVHPISSEAYSGYTSDNPSDPINISLGVVPRLYEVRIPYSGYSGQGFQVFTPTRIISLAVGQSLGLSQTSAQARVKAIRVQVATDYRINGQGETATLPAGSVTGISQNARFFNFPNGGIVEVM
jgi:hypothetical protein